MIRAWAVPAAVLVLWSVRAAATPYPDPRGVPVDEAKQSGGTAILPVLGAEALRAGADPVLRVQLRWHSTDDRFAVEALEVERSGTDALRAAARREDPHGSFKARLVDPRTGEPLAYASLGTGAAYKYLVRALTFRFPLPASPVRLELKAENGVTGIMEVVLTETLDPAAFTAAPVTPELDVRRLRAASSSPFVVVNVYAEGYAASARERFFREAQRVVSTLEQRSFPQLERFEMRAVFAPSNLALGAARDLGRPIPERDSHLGLYFPYWYDFGRYYHIVYPTRERRYRRAIGSLPYDYPIALVDDAQYWGVGNFKELTAVPARNGSFSYLLMHELGHYFGLNEEYEGGGPTELAFAPEVEEPWSQNITFQAERSMVKWGRHIAASTPVPTPRVDWRSGHLGVYEGGYADTPKPGSVYKPGFSCTMEAKSAFCAVCSEALSERVRIDLGL
jgi:hypothetical protein